jgi:hypothetical protein
MNTRLEILRRLFLVAAALTLGLLSGCLFDTRDAEDPGASPSTWQVPSVPTRVFLNMASGLEELTGVNYTRSIHDNFTFVPLPEDANNPTLAGKFDNWTADVEKNVVNRLTSESSSMQVSFTNRQQIRDQNPFADFRVDYELIVTSPAAPPDTIRGKAQFDMQDGSKGWQLVRWEDIERVSGFATWGFLRGSLRQ